MATDRNYEIGGAAVLLAKSAETKSADTPVTSYGLTGKLYLSKSGWILMSVPNALGQGAFAALNENGVELPPGPGDSPYNAHISVIRPEEMLAAGIDPESISERGKEFSYTLGPVRTVSPEGWGEMSKVWFIEVNSPDLKQLRKSYGLTPLPSDNEHQFHISFAVRRKGVLKPNEISKAASLDSVYMNAAKGHANSILAGQTPLYNTSQGLMSNIKNQLSAIRERGDRYASEAANLESLRSAADPNRTLNRFRAQLSGQLPVQSEHPIDQIVKMAVENELWREVPQLVAGLIKEAAPIAQTVKKIVKSLSADTGYGYVFYHPENRELWAVLGDGDDQTVHQKWHNALKAVKGISRVQTTSEDHPKPRDEWIMIKRSLDGSVLGAPFRLGGAMTGGPSPLSNAIVGGLLAGGAGYLGGTALEHLMPEEYVERGRLRKTLALAGAGLGAVPGLWQGFNNHQNAAAAGKPQSVLQTAVMPNSQTPINPQFEQDMKAQGASSGTEYQFDGPNAGMFKKSHKDVMMELLAVCNNRQLPAMKAASYASFYKLAAPLFDDNLPDASINADTFQHALFADRHTPMPVAATAAGLSEGVAQMYGKKNLLSPKHFISGLAAAGADLMTAHLVGGTLGALAGLTPQAQKQLQTMGIWGGLLRGTIGSLLS